MSLRSARPAALYLRILVAWLIAMQPMIAGYAASAMAATPFTGVLCSGAQAPDTDIPAGTTDHRECCLVCAVPSLATPPAMPDTPVPASARAAAAQYLLAADPALQPAGLGPQSARAPPL